MSVSPEDPCACSPEQAKSCPVLKHKMIGRSYDICRGTALTPDRRNKYRAMWLRHAALPPGQAPVPIVPSSGCGGCGKRKSWLNKVSGKLRLGDKVEAVTKATGIKKRVDDRADRKRREAAAKKGVAWAYGVTTVPARRDLLLPRTLASLKLAGFDTPRLFVDGDSDPGQYASRFGLPVTTRDVKLRTFGNWVLSLWELYARNPKADRYAIFQDDFVTYRNLRLYLDACPYPERGYWNLYTFPANQRRAPSRTGWFLSDQMGKGAVALVFSRDAVTALLAQPHMVNRPQSETRGWKGVDGAIVTAMKKAGYREFVHNPSLVQHTGKKSSMGNSVHALASSFKGEAYDAANLMSGG